MSIKELAALVRQGRADDSALADYASEYAKARKVFRKKDD
ncbi:hypothetical protein SAMN04489726_4973 [Allokutzneria albata]|uniref:Uncharacterized protein n=1 Tax=Allokutzneria albata TaxID=211114 RepID=A0A1G9YRF4_ALLAB|nr:hypothetical protein SAMN04489726_4973 [Allokutzneria albata]